MYFSQLSILGAMTKHTNLLFNQNEVNNPHKVIKVTTPIQYICESLRVREGFERVAVGDGRPALPRNCIVQAPSGQRDRRGCMAQGATAMLSCLSFH
jgi:hypothetical protein